jgi:hypothetical protein
MMSFSSVTKRSRQPETDTPLLSLLLDASKWCNQFPVPLMNETFSYLNGHDMLLGIERTCSYWSYQSKNGIGWYHINIDEWILPKAARFISFTSPSYQWLPLTKLLNTRLSNSSSSSNSSDSDIGIATTTVGMPTTSNTYIASYGIRSISGKYVSFNDLVDILNHCHRLQYVNLTISIDSNDIHHNNNNNNGRSSLDDVTRLLSYSTTIVHLSLTLNQSVSTLGKSLNRFVIPTIPSLTKLILHVGTTITLVGIQPLINLRSLDIDCVWIPILSDNDTTTTITTTTSLSLLQQQWLLPYITDLTLSSPSRYHGTSRSLSEITLNTLGMSSCRTLQSLRIISNLHDTEMKILLFNPSIHFTSLLSLSIYSVPPGNHDQHNNTSIFHQFPCLRHLTIEIVSPPIHISTLTQRREWLISLFIPLIHLISFKFISSTFMYDMEPKQVFCNVLSSLPSLTHINDQSCDQWLINERTAPVKQIWSIRSSSSSVASSSASRGSQWTSSSSTTGPSSSSLSSSSSSLAWGGW